MAERLQIPRLREDSLQLRSTHVPLCISRNNCYGTLNVLDLAAQMPNLKSFVHVSTYFVNNHMPRNQLIEEKIFPLDLGGISASEMVAQIMAAPKEEAAALAAKHMAR
jgi:fatty acyl-CoA reductase